MTDQEYAEAMQVLASYSAKEVLFRTLFAETRGQPIEAQVGVGSVIRKRLFDSRWPDTFQQVCLQPAQFSCYNPGDPNFPKLLDPEANERPEVLAQLRHVAAGIVDGLFLDNVSGANHYYDLSIIVGRGQQRDPVRLQRYLKAVDLILLPLAYTGAQREEIEAAKDLIHTLVKDLPPKWDNETLPVARKGQLVFFRL